MFFVKDLSRIGRDLSRTIIIDNTAENFQRQVNNGLFIKSFYDDPEDTELAEMLPFLKCKHIICDEISFRHRSKEKERRASRSEEIQGG